MKTRFTAIVALASVLGGCAGLIRGQIYAPPTTPLASHASRAKLGADVRDVTVTTADGLALRGLETAGRADKPVILFFHGNASGAASVMVWLAPVLERGYGFVSAEYRGYSGNPGKPTQTGLARDADAFYARARALAGSRPVWVVGHSLGGGVAFDLALRQRLDALMTIGTFTSATDVAPKFARAFVPDRYDNRGAVARLDEPLFLIHGDADTTIPMVHARGLHEAAKAAGRTGAAIILPGQGHGPDAEILAIVLDAVHASAGDVGKLAAATPASTRIVPF